MPTMQLLVHFITLSCVIPVTSTLAMIHARDIPGLTSDPSVFNFGNVGGKPQAIFQRMNFELCKFQLSI